MAYHELWGNRNSLYRFECKAGVSVSVTHEAFCRQCGLWHQGERLGFFDIELLEDGSLKFNVRFIEGRAPL